MIRVVLRKELLEASRDRRFLVILAVLVGLVLASSLDGWNRTRAEATARAAAEVADHQIWVEQGDNNPHSAAHFARYAFRQTPALAAFDPGLFDHAGAAFWMEAHTRNPTTLRRVEDAAVSAPFPSLSPAWTIQVVGTLMLTVLLFASVAAEREAGTLRSLAAAGVHPRSLALGKAGGAFVVAATASLAVMIISLAPGLVMVQELELSRVVVLGAGYVLALAASALAALAVSAHMPNPSSAFVAAAGLWLFTALVVPMTAGQLATTLHPDIDERELKNRIQLEAQSAFWVGDAREPAVAVYEREVVEEFGAKTFDELGFNRDALALQAHERFANAVYDDLYRELEGVHTDQDRVLRVASILSPVLAVRRISAAIASTDLHAQLGFAHAAEAHRRTIIEQLNRHMMINADDKGYGYKVGKELWEQIPDFVATPPSLASALSRSWLEFASLMIWLATALALAVRGTRIALRGGSR